MKIDTLRPELKCKIQDWITSFYHLDPRYKILTFFNLVATVGADDMIDDSKEDVSNIPMRASNNSYNSSGHSTTTTSGTTGGESHTSVLNHSKHSKNSNSDSHSKSSPNIPAVRSNSITSNSSDHPPSAPTSTRGAALLESRPSARNISPWMLDLLSKMFNSTSILTVWRPCSNDAMRKMMEGTGVGKGLDIKGKSAKKGILSAFVPFMQIFKQDHMNEIQPIAVGANMRVYYKDEKMRDYVLSVLEDFLVNGPKKCKKKKKKKSIFGIGSINITSPTAKEEEKSKEEKETSLKIEELFPPSDTSTDILESEASTEELEFVDMIEGNNDLTQSKKKALEDAAADIFGGDHDEEGISPILKEEIRRSTAAAAADAVAAAATEEVYKEEQEARNADFSCVAHGQSCNSLQAEPGAVRASTNGEERVEAAMIAADRAVALAETEEAAALEAAKGITSKMKAEAVIASAKIRGSKMKEEALAAAAEVVAVVAAAASKAHIAAAYENPFGADNDDCGHTTDSDSFIVDDDDGSDSDSDNDDADADADDDIYVGNFDHQDQNSPRYCPLKPLKKIKKFAKSGYYGIECSQRLFWFATVQDACIERKGTGTETGRPSLPGFQDANMKTLKAATAQIPKPSPMPVLLQHHSLEDCMNKRSNDDLDGGAIIDAKYNPLQEGLDPIYLVMAYEEQGTVKPVVSDFDGFLLGWRREALWFGCNLPREQESLMMWCVDHIEEVLEGQRQNPTNGDTWTIRWLDILKKEAARGFHVEMPEYGFGDPKSTSIMEHAAKRLQSTGAVRHGSECFNYQFPQEIDDMFLLISDTLKPVPFKYVAVEELQDILRTKIKEGFVFPLNPKWILCDPGWKTVYDELMACDSLYSDLSKDVWFPPHTGIRDRIEEVVQKYPEGFNRCTDPSKATCGNKSPTDALRDSGLGSALTGNAAADLAQMELDDFTCEVKDKKLRASTIIGAAGRKKIAELGMTMANLKEDNEEETYIDSNGSIKTSTTSTVASITKKGISWGESIHKRGGNSNNNHVGRRKARRGSGVSQNSSVSSSGTINTLSNTTKDAPAEDTTCNSAPKGLRKVIMSTKKLFHRSHKSGSSSSSSGSRPTPNSRKLRRKSSEERRSRAAHTIHGGDAGLTTSCTSAPLSTDKYIKPRHNFCSTNKNHDKK